MTTHRTAPAHEQRGTIWWDFDGTLASRPRMWSEAGLRFLRHTFPQHPIAVERFRASLSTGFPWHQPWRAHTEMTTADLWWACIYDRFLAAFAELECPLIEERSSLAAIRREILDPRRYSLFADTRPVLEELHAHGWRQVVVSNHVPELQEIIDGLGIGGFFFAVLTSAIVGYEKPHARMFEAALTHSVAGAPIWMIGDNLEVDCIPAASFGARAILVRTEASFERCAGNLWDASALIRQSGQHAI